MAAGHGGQILLSQATCSVLEDDELPGISVRDLGEHRLKDLDRPERIYQLDAEGLPTGVPAPAHRRGSDRLYRPRGRVGAGGAGGGLARATPDATLARSGGRGVARCRRLDRSSSR